MSTANAGSGDDAELVMSPFEEVRAQLGRQKWAVDSHDADTLRGVYTRHCTLILKHEGKAEIQRVGGGDAIIAHIQRGWAARTDWTPGSMIHHIGTVLIEPAPDGRIRCRSYATYVHVVLSGATEIHGYGKYHDLWAKEDGQWRLAEREVHLFGLTLPKL